MARNAQVYKLSLAVADMDRHHYENYATSVALHPSETEQRMLWRIATMAYVSQPGIQFGRGISSDEEPDLWVKDDTGAIKLWVELGQPDERRIRKACSRADRVMLFAYGRQATQVWWQNIQSKLSRFSHLDVFEISSDDESLAESILNRTMNLSATIQDGGMMLADGDAHIEIKFTKLNDRQRG